MFCTGFFSSIHPLVMYSMNCNEEMQEVVDLSREGQQLLWEEVAMASRALQLLFNPHKLNIASLGNVVWSSSSHLDTMTGLVAYLICPVGFLGSQCVKHVPTRIQAMLEGQLRTHQ